MAEGFAREHVRQMDLDKRDPDGGQRIPHGHAGMGVGGGVDDDEIDLVPARLLNTLDEFGLGIALVGLEAGSGLLGRCGQPRLDRLQGVLAVVIRLADAEQVQIGAIDEQDVFVRGCHIEIVPATPVSCCKTPTEAFRWTLDRRKFAANRRMLSRILPKIAAHGGKVFILRFKSTYYIIIPPASVYPTPGLRWMHELRPRGHSAAASLDCVVNGNYKMLLYFAHRIRAKAGGLLWLAAALP